MTANKKFQIFLSITKKLNKLGVIPALYGSLALYKITGNFIKIDDIDFLVPKKFLNSNWKLFKKFIVDLGHVQDPDHIHEFSKGSLIISFDSFENLFESTNINLKSLKNRKIKGAVFKLPTAEILLKIYSECLKNTRRKEKKEKEATDLNKIKFLEAFIKTVPTETPQ
jgi:hypothetical protein